MVPRRGHPKSILEYEPQAKPFHECPKELGLPSGLVARHVKCVYGTGDAGALWEDVCRHCVESMGFVSGVASLYCFFHEELIIIFFLIDTTTSRVEPEVSRDRSTWTRSSTFRAKKSLNLLRM